MAKKKKLKKKPKIILMILLIIILIGVGAFSYHCYVNKSEVKENKVVSKIPEYGYELKSNKSEAYKKMFWNSDIISTDDLNTLRVNNNYKTYFNGMAQAANEGIAEILKRGKPYIKTLCFTRKTSDNLLGNRLGIVYDHTNEDIVFEIDKGLAYYFEVDNEATIEVYVGDEIVEVLENDVENLGSYTKYKNFLENNDNKTVPINVFTKNTFPILINANIKNGIFNIKTVLPTGQLNK